MKIEKSLSKTPLSARLISPFLKIFFRLLYHEFAWSYDLVAASVSLGLWKRWVFSVIPYLNGPRVLELGFGPGHLQTALAHLDIFSIGLDESRQMAGMAFRRMMRIGFNPLLINGYAHFLPFPSSSFHQVIATFPSEYIIKPETLAEIYRILYPGGCLVILPFAWITGEDLLHRLAAALFHFTGEAPDWDNALLKPFHQAGFYTRLETKTIDKSKVIIILAEKPHP